MKRLLKNGIVVNVFTGELERENVLIEDEKIIGVGQYSDNEADEVEDVSEKYICPGFIDGHIHIESTLLTPAELARICMPHGTTSIVADPHEIANVCGISGIKYMLEISKNLPMNVYIMLPSCVPSTQFDESGAVLSAEDLTELYKNSRVLGLAEMMNYPGVLADDKKVYEKISDAVKHNRVVDGHAPLLTGKALDKYIAAGIQSDHECSSAEEGRERIRKGQWLMIRQGTAAKNLEALLPMFDEPYCHRCLLVTDDRFPADIMKEGHIDNIIRLAVKSGKSVITAIRMATIQAAQCFGLRYVGAVAAGYRADILVLDNLEEVSVCDVYSAGKKAVCGGEMCRIQKPQASKELCSAVTASFKLDELKREDFHIEERSDSCRIIKIYPGQLLTDELIENINWDKDNGIDTERDILKLAVIERHNNTGHKGIGFISGVGLKKGAIASSVSHDSHNLIVIGASDEDMAVAANRIREIGGGNVVVADGRIIAEMRLPIAGLMTEEPAEEIVEENQNVRESVYTLGVPGNIAPFMNMSFVSLPVIPSLKMTTRGLVDVNKQERVSLYV